MIELEESRQKMISIIEANEPPESKSELSADEYRRTYQEPWYISSRKKVEDAVKVLRVLYCLACAENCDNGWVQAWRCFVRFEDDELGALPHGLVHVTCYHCNFDLLVPRRNPLEQFTAQAAEELKRRIDADILQKTTSPYHFGAGMGNYVPPPSAMRPGSVMKAPPHSFMDLNAANRAALEEEARQLMNKGLELKTVVKMMRDKYNIKL